MIRIIAGGKRHPDWLRETCAEYEKRLRKPWNIEWEFVEESRLEDRVLRLDKNNFIILLDEHGTMYSSPEFCNILRAPLETGRDVVIVIGGSFGHFSSDVTARANAIWSLSKLVFPHQVCRLIVSEQVYRAQEICYGHPYHHA